MERSTCSEHNNANRSDSAGKDDLIMGVGFGRSSVADLTFQVFNRSLHPEWFATREFRRVEQKRWSADVRIVEGGHAVIFSSRLRFASPKFSAVRRRSSGAWATLSLASSSRTLGNPASGRNSRVSELPRSGTSRYRSLPPPLRGDRTECVRKPAFPAFSRVESDGTASDQPRPVERQRRRPVDSMLPLLPE